MTNLSGANLNNGAAVGPQGEGMDSPSSFPEYPAYKDSGVEWLGEVPEHWEVGSFRRLIKSVGNGTTADQVDEADDTVAVSRIETISTGQINFEKAGHVAPQDVAKRFLLNAGDILFSHINSLSMVGNVAIYLGGRPLLHGMNLLRIQPLSSVSSEWVLYWLKSKNIRQEVESRAKPAINQASISTDSVRALPGLIPPKVEQTQIARFLDHETARIDALIEEQQRLIELLKEKRQAVISHAVTKGLDPTVPMKDSGVEWLGEVPAHWEITAVKYVVRSLGQGWSPQCDNYPAEDGEWGVLKVGCVNGGVFNPAENKHLPVELEPDEALAIKQGDLLISRANTRELVGGAAVATKDYPRLMLCDKLYRLRLSTERAAPEFLALYLGSSAPREQIELAASGASDSMQNISQSVVMDMPISLPPLGEQEAILQFLGSTLKNSDELVAKVTSQRYLLQERRSALISAAVTGKVDVRGWQPPASAPTPELVQEAV